MILNLILIYLLIGLAIALYDFYGSPQHVKDEPFFIIILAQIILIVSWPFYMVRR